MGDQDGRERRDLVSGQTRPEAELIRFVAGPDGYVAPDLARRLPGRGLWVAADRASIEMAAKKGLFARAAKAPLKAPDGLADLVERLLVRRCLDQLGLARREGVLISGLEKTLAAIRSGRAAWVIEARDGSEDGRRRVIGAVAAQAEAQNPPPQVCAAFTAEDLGLALGLENAIHHVLPVGPRALRWADEVRRLSGFRPILPPERRDQG
ncbi:RNA-binding protein [Brevundimonas sp. 2R-24]|uniref:RNA-binding protein n=1 Tax=Peiella sedimenti TaxID=3061083 RepID=A0ABT8SKQ0_9CAUL|nr:RNA-binding protein [Caulobacteraceae bacterium XZ-24]